MMSCDVRVSRLPVGSSASSTTRIVDQRARDRDALLLAARQLPGRIALAIAETEQTRARPRARSKRAALADAARRRIEQRQRDVLDRAGARQQVEALKDEAQPLAANARELRLGEPRHIDAFEIVVAAGRPVEAAENAPSASTSPTPTIP